MSRNNWGVNKRLIGKKSQIDIQHQGYYYKCKKCGIILSSMNDDCGCSEPFMQVFDVSVRSVHPS